MSSVAAYSAMTVYIMSGAELHIFNNFPALEKGINCPKIQNEGNFNDGMLPQRSPRAQLNRHELIYTFCPVSYPRLGSRIA